MTQQVVSSDRSRLRLGAPRTELDVLDGIEAAVGGSGWQSAQRLGTVSHSQNLISIETYLCG